MQTLQQQRAKHALGKIEGLANGDNKDQREKLKSRASELPYMIHANGLGQAAAFFKSKGKKDGYDALFGILADWLREPGRPYAGKCDLMQAITESDFRLYRAAQAEAMQYMDWVKKFAKAYL